MSLVARFAIALAAATPLIGRARAALESNSTRARAPPPGTLPDLELLEVTPRTLPRVADGRRIVVVAFVNPALPRSATFHATLHELNAQLHVLYSQPARATAGGEDDGGTMRLAYADVGAHRAFVKQYSLKSLPTILAFPRGPNLSFAPFSIAYEDNKTAAHFRREVEHIVAACDGLATMPSAVGQRVEALAESVLEREASMMRAASAAGARAAVKTAAAAAVAVDAATGAAAERSAPPAVVEPSAAEVEAAQLHNQTLTAQLDLSDEIETQLAVLEARRTKLLLLRELAASVAANGTAAMARGMNAERALALQRASTVPLDLEMVGASAAGRLKQLSRVSLLVDLFERLHR
jgi:hypothetical protein